MKSKLLAITLSLAIIFTMGIYTPAFGAEDISKRRSTDSDRR